MAKDQTFYPEITPATGASSSSSSSTSTGGNIDNSLLADMPADTLKGNNTGSAAAPSDLTALQVRSLLNKSPTFTTILASGSGTYTPPSGTLWLRVRMVGGGGGGGGSGTTGATSGGSGGNTTFGTSLLTAFGGNGGAGGANSGSNASGPIGSVASPAIGFYIPGGTGESNDIQTVTKAGGTGGSTPLGQGGKSTRQVSGAHTGGNYGGGGSGAGNNGVASSYAGGGGSGGAYVEAIIPAPLDPSYSYAVGVGGSAGGLGTSGGNGALGSIGCIIIEEYYQ